MDLFLPNTDEKQHQQAGAQTSWTERRSDIYMRNLTLLVILTLSLMLSACGGDGSTVLSSDTGTPTIAAKSGVVVDPYIVNAVLEEADSNGTVIQTATTNSTGAYDFTTQLNIGSTLRLRAGNLGQHAGAPYTVVLRRTISSGDTAPVVVSPLTTLLADGTTPAELLQALNDAGLTGLTEANLYSDPMAGLSNLTDATDTQLKVLQAAMTVGSFLEATTSSAPTTNAVVSGNDQLTFNACATAVLAMLNTSSFQQVASDLASDPTIATLTLGDFIQASAVQIKDVVSQIKTDLTSSGSVNMTNMDNAMQMALADLSVTTKDQYQQRVGQTPGNGIDGQMVFTNECDVCHALSGGGTMDLSGKGSLVEAKLAAGHNGKSLTADELSALAIYLDGITPPPTPTPVDGPTLYDNNCASCHGALASTSKPGRTATQIQNAIDGNVGGMGFLSSLTAAEVQAIADALPAGNGGPDYSDCTACHGQPPNGTTFPNEAGAHLVHQALPGVGTTCAVCHATAAHNGNVDLAFPTDYDAKSGAATDNLDGTCSSIICHGGQTTPDWWTGTLNVDTQCTSCHQSGTSQYNSYNSGQHGRSEHRNRACTVCHNTAKMANHFGDLTTPGFETDPATTVGGGSTSVGSYDGTSCSNIACHGSKRW